MYLITIMPLLVRPLSGRYRTKDFRVCGVRLQTAQMKDWKKGYIRVIPQKSNKTKNKWAIQFLSDGIKEKIENGTFQCKHQSSECPTLEIENYSTAGITIPTIWDSNLFYTSKGTELINTIFSSKTAFTYAKPLDLICEIFGRISSKDDFILDSFAGSGTTAHAVLNMNKADGGNRKFILVEMMDYADSITAERVKRVIQGYGEGKKAVEGTGGSFSFYDLGPVLLLPDGNLNEEVGPQKIRNTSTIWRPKSLYPPNSLRTSHISWVCAATPLITSIMSGESVTTLDYAFLATIQTKAEGYTIYADLCAISQETLYKHNITFKKIPRDIARL